MHRHAGPVVAQRATLWLPGGAWGEVAAGRAAVDAVLVGGGVGAGREEAAYRGEPRGGLGTGTKRQGGYTGKHRSEGRGLKTPTRLGGRGGVGVAHSGGVGSWVEGEWEKWEITHTPVALSPSAPP